MNNIKRKKEILVLRKTYKVELEKQLLQITNSKFYKFFIKYQKFIRLLKPQTYTRYLNKYKYNLSNYETPNHGFIILKLKTKKWKIDGYEKVGEDWHIRIIRIHDSKFFLLDQPFFYYLQIFDSININCEKELFITYGITKEKLQKINKSLKFLNLC